MIANNSANSVRFRWKNHYFWLYAYAADGVKKSYTDETGWKVALHKGFRYACQRPVIALELVCFIVFLTISAISSRACCKIWRTTMQRKADGHAIHKQTLMTFHTCKSLHWAKKSSRVWTELQHSIGFNNTEQFSVIWGYFKNVISVNLLILANDPGKCPTAKISSANFQLIALG